MVAQWDRAQAASGARTLRRTVRGWRSGLPDRPEIARGKAGIGERPIFTGIPGSLLIGTSAGGTPRAAKNRWVMRNQIGIGVWENLQAFPWSLRVGLLQEWWRRARNEGCTPEMRTELKCTQSKKI